jgi:2-polyprenyl-3-methyl-5-hydroxy-6-metoxy-1,4-benzoquinol methylase
MDNQSLLSILREEFQVSVEVHEEDFLLKFLQHHLQDNETALKHYFDNGRESAIRIREIINRNLHPSGIATINPNDFSLLDFASGFGMVNRHFSVVMPEARVEASDIHPKAVEFHATHLNIKCHLSNYKPSNLNISNKYDAIVALSFFSHMPSQSWLPWLRRLCDLLAEGGMLIFTTHGPSSSVASTEKFIHKGLDFYFYPESEQDDLIQTEYGTACAHPSFAMKVFQSLPDMHLSEYKQGIWWGGTQDVYVLTRRTSCAQIYLRSDAFKMSSIADQSITVQKPDKIKFSFNK